MVHDPDNDRFAAQLATRLRRHYSAGASGGDSASSAALAERLDDLAAALNSGERYRIRDEIDRGGMGRVCLAHDRALGRDVARKQAGPAASSAHQQLRLLAESTVVGELHHPGIVPVHDVGTLPDGRVFYTMKLVEGQRLDEHAEKTPALRERLRILSLIHI